VNPKSRGLLFLHIPKTAGTTFAMFLSKNVGVDKSSDGLMHVKWRDALARYWDYRLISGHLRAVIGDQLPSDRDSIVLLREPLDRFLSRFFFQSRDVSDIPLSQDSATSNLDLDSYIDLLTNAEREPREASSEREATNLQTEMLFPLGTSVWPPHSREAKVAAAQQALDHFQFVGIQSDIDDFAVMVARSLGWPATGEIGYANVTSQRMATDDLTSEQRRRLRRLLEPDLEVYAYARARFLRDRRNVLMHAGSPLSETDAGAMAPEPTARAPEATPSSGASTNGGAAEFGNRLVEIIQVEASGELSGQGNMLTGELVTITVHFVAHKSAEDFTVALSIKDRRGATLFGSNTRLQGGCYDISVGAYRAVFKFFNRFGEGSYFVDIDLHKATAIFEEPYHSRRSAARFDVVGRCGAYFEGAFLLDVDASITPVDDANLSTRQLNDAIAPTLFVGRLSPPLCEFSAHLRQLEEVQKLNTADGLLVSIEITNTSVSKWPSSGKRPVHLSYHWHTESGDVLVANGLRTRLGEDMEPGSSVVVRGLLRAPDVPGIMTLTWDMVQEHVRWFSDRKSRCAISSVVLVT
jgi:hypothetical protein